MSNFSLKTLILLLVFLPGGLSVAETPTRFSDLESWTGIYYKEKKLGFSHVIMRVSPASIQVSSKMYFRMSTGKTDQSTSFAQEASFTPDLRLKEFSLLQEVMGSRQHIAAKAGGGKLIMDIASLESSKETSLPFPPDSALSSTIILNLMREGLEVGRKGKRPVFIEPLRIFSDLQYEIMRKETVESEGKPVEAFVIMQNIGGMESTMWVAPNGIVLREISPQGFESKKEPRETAQDLGEEIMSVGNFITLSIVKTERGIADSKNKKMARYKLANLRTPELVPQDHRQRIVDAGLPKDDTYAVVLAVKSEPVQPVKPVTLPIKLFPEKAWLSDTPEIQSDHPLIRSLTKLIVKEESNSWIAAQAINEWVFKNLEKVLVDNATALDTLRTRQGECQSHTNLFVALARATGIPARVINGLVYSDEYGGFVYHAWPEVYVGEWRALDPTFGQTRVDATHIKLAEGNSEGTLKLMEFMGKLQIEVLED